MKNVRQQNAERRLRHLRWAKPDVTFRIKLGLLILSGCLAFTFLTMI